MSQQDVVTRIALAAIIVLLAALVWEARTIERQVAAGNGVGWVCTDNLVHCKVEIVGSVQLDEYTIRHLRP